MKILRFKNSSWVAFCEYCLVKRLISGLNVHHGDNGSVLLAVHLTGAPGIDEAIKDFGAEVVTT